MPPPGSNWAGDPAAAASPQARALDPEASVLAVPQTPDEQALPSREMAVTRDAAGQMTEGASPGTAPVEALAVKWEVLSAQIFGEVPLTEWTRGHAERLAQCATEARDRLAPEWGRLSAENEGLREQHDRCRGKVSADEVALALYDANASLAGELTEERRKLAEVMECAHNFNDVREIERLTRELAALTARDTALTQALRKSIAATPPGSVPGQVAFEEYDRATREALALVTRERDEAREKLARMREDRDRLNVQRNALAGANDAWTRDVDAARAELATVAAERDKLRDSTRTFGSLAAMFIRGMYAAWIDAQRGDLAAVKGNLSEGCDGFEGTPWDGTETGQQWLERTQGESGDGTPYGTFPEASETAAILADPEAMAAIAEGESELPAKACGHEFSLSGVRYRCERAPHPVDGYGPAHRHAAGIDEELAEGTGDPASDGPATLVTWGEDSQGDGQDWAIAWGTVEGYGTPGRQS
jgi:predicted  nucleic acid-binding Zn-ribbon protein